jgi:excisionase family DNA binding protein
MEDKFYTTYDLAKIMKVNYRTILTLIKTGKISAVNLGTSKRPLWRIYEGQYRKFLAENYK